MASVAIDDWPSWKGVNLRHKNRPLFQRSHFLGLFHGSHPHIPKKVCHVPCSCSTPPTEKELSPAGRVDVRFRKRQPFSPLCLNEGSIAGHTRPHGIYRPSCIIHRARAHTVSRESRCRPGACPRRYAPSMTVARPVLHRPSHFAEKRGGCPDWTRSHTSHRAPIALTDPHPSPSTHAGQA